MDLMFPIHCVICRSVVRSRQKKHPLCSDCEDDLPVLQLPACRVCSRPLRTTQGNKIHNLPPEALICGSCRTGSVRVNPTVAGFTYTDAMRTIIGDWKFGGYRKWSEWLADRLRDVILDRIDFDRWDIVIPVPLHPDRRNERGFNQSRDLAEFLTAPLSISCGHWLQKTLRTIPQTELTRSERKTNLKGAFELSSEHRIEGRRALLVDDIYTTGSTLDTCAEVLLNAGSDKVGAIVLARSI